MDRPASYQITALTQEDFPRVAEYLDTQAWESERSSEASSLERGGVPGLAMLSWLLRNPARGPEMELGQLLKDDQGRIAGTHLCIPERFVWRERVYTGVCSSAFFVMPQARMQGFLLFRRFQNGPDGDFKFATTCNKASGDLWARMRGKPVPGTEMEHLFPQRLGGLAAEFALRKGTGSIGAGLASFAGNMALPLMRLRRQRPRFETRLCEDWERLAALARAARDPERMTGERSVESLTWRYGQSPSRSRISIFVFTENGRDVGWCSLRSGRRGQRNQIRTQTLMELVWPVQRRDFKEALETAVAMSDRQTDVVSFRTSAGLGNLPVELGGRTRALAGPSAYVYGGEGIDDLANRLTLMPVNGDTAT